MNSKPTIEIDVDVTPDASSSKPAGYRFRYASSSKWVSDNGNIDLQKEKKDVLLEFRLAGGTFDSDDPVWVEPFEEGGKVPCPETFNHQGAIGKPELIDPTTLRFRDKNNDKKRYAYALRCRVGGVDVMDDPVIINR
jgi:hypothetical protein